MNKLNQDYFKTRNTHKANVSSGAWFSVVLVLCGLLMIMYFATRDYSKLRETEQEHYEPQKDVIPPETKTSVETRASKNYVEENFWTIAYSRFESPSNAIPPDG